MPRNKNLTYKGSLSILEWTQRKLPPYLTKDEVHQVLKGVQRNRFYHLLINFLWQTGARVTEALSVKVSDIDFYSKVVRMPSLKKKEPQVKTIPLKGELLGELGAYIGQEGLRKGDRIFNITRQHAHKIIKDACIKAGIERKRARPHVLRHSFAINAVYWSYGAHC